MRLRRGRLDHRAVGREIAAQHREAAATATSALSRGRITSWLYTSAPAMFSPSVLPLTVRASSASRSPISFEQRAQAAGVVEILHQVLARRAACWRCSGVRCARSRRSGRASARCRRGRAIATRCTTRVGRAAERQHRRDRVVDAGRASGSRAASGPPTPSRRCAGRSPPPCAPWRESAAGIDAAPGSVKPSASRGRGHRRSGAHRHAVAGRARDAVLDLAPVLVGDVAGALLGPVFPDVGAAAERLAAPVAAQHRARRHEDRRAGSC